MQNYTSRTSIDLVLSALKAGEPGARTVAVESIFNKLKPATRLALQRAVAQNTPYRGPLDGKLSSAFVQAMIAYAKKLEASP
jgi:hypothetical protein